MTDNVRRLFVFDLMDTVVRDPFFSVVLAKRKDSIDRFKTHYNPQIWPQFEKGLISEDEFIHRFYFDLKAATEDELDPPENLRDEILQHYYFIEGMECLLEELLANEENTLTVLSNYPIWFETLRCELKLDRFFSAYAISYQTGYRKPDPAAYSALCDQFDNNFDEIIMIDDRKENCIAAISLGWRAIHFRSVNELKSTLFNR